MKNLFYIFILLCSISAHSQSAEFKVYSNGFIYSQDAMTKLSGIVDSLNLMYKSCDLNRKYYSKSQAIGHILTLNGKDSKTALKDIEEGISYDDFIKKHPKVSVKENALIVRFNHQDYNKKEVVDFTEIDLVDGYGKNLRFRDNLKKYKYSLDKQWITNHSEKSSYTNETLTAFYIPNNFKSLELPLKYQKMIGYSNCLVDTTTVKIRENSKIGYLNMPKNWRNFPLNKKKKLLEKLRTIKVYGSCSMDDSPRIHALNIALLSAETINWNVFLKSHLDIMNDRFDRASDGSYAWANRNTYIKELEYLNINVKDLILGISLRIENPSKNHYYGSISRVGRAISESDNLNVIQKSILNMIEDSTLDDYNRVLAYFLYLNQNHFIKNEKTKKENLNLLEESIKKLPYYLAKNIDLNK